MSPEKDFESKAPANGYLFRLQTPSQWRFSDRRVSWVVSREQQVRIEGPAATVFFPSVDQRK